MSFLTKRNRSPYWWAGWQGPDGRKIFRSTKCEKEDDALQVLAKWQGMTNKAKAGLLTEEQVRKVAVDLFFRATGETMERHTVQEYLEAWAKRKELEVADSSAGEYKRIAEEFVKSLGQRAGKDLSSVSAKHVLAWRDLLSTPHFCGECRQRWTLKSAAPQVRCQAS